MKPFAFFASLMMTAAALAQSYSVDWYKIAGGGGTSSGGNYTLVGTIGQHDAGKLSGGNYTLEGGFLAGIGLVQTPGAPTLSIRMSGTDAIVSWAADASTGFVLEQTTTLTGTTIPWGVSGATVTTNGNTKSVTVPATGVKFYRLHKPQF